MKKKKKEKVVKGTPTAVLISILIHAGLFLLAGMFVVFTVVKHKEVEFEPPKPVERPKMKLKKPRVKVKKTAKPKPTNRIVTKVKTATMPDIQLPEMSGMAEGLGSGFGGFDMMPDLGEMTIFGGGQTIGNDFVGTFYDLKHDRNGRSLNIAKEQFVDILTRFVKSGWRESLLSRYYRSPKKLYATCFMVPPIKSTLGPRAFGEDCGGWCWMVLYKGKLVYPEDIKFRFWGFGDDILLVRVDGKLVLNGNWHNDGSMMYITEMAGSWSTSATEDAQYYYGNNKARVSNWIELKGGKMYDMEVMIGEVPGGVFSSMLTVQVYGEKYPKNRQGAPILPMFKTEEPSRELQDIILASLIQNEASVTNGPVFRDYAVSESTNKTEEVADEAPPAPPPVDLAKDRSKMRTWTTTDGRTLQARFVSLLGGKVVLKTAKGRQVKVPFNMFSEADRKFVELANPPKFSIDFLKLSDSKLGRYQLSPMELQWNVQPPRVNDFTFGARVKQIGAGDYHHEVTVEYFAIGKELIGNKYILLDRGSSTFVPTKENGRSHTFKGKPVEFVEYEIGGELRGRRPDGNIVIITDELGRIIQHTSSKSWLWENIDKLRKLPVGAYMDKTCTRAYPTSPKPTLW